MYSLGKSILNLHKKRNHSDNIYFRTAGFSMIEILVAIFIIGVSFIGIVYAFPFSLSIIKTAENETVASYLAQEKLEEINQLDYIDIATGTIETRHALGATGTVLHVFERETVSACVDENIVVSSTETGLKLVVTRVYYLNSIGKTEDEYSISTLIANR